MDEILRQLVFDTVRHLQGKRIAEGVIPDFVPANEVISHIDDAVKSAADSLIRDGRLEWFKNVNGVAMLGMANDDDLKS